jgi:FAD/FMN-containing dehydrogenase
MKEPGRLTRLSGWGRYPVAECQVVRPRSTDDMAVFAEAQSLIARGCGRSYGDASLNTALTVETGAANRLLAFDEATGLLICEAGLTLADIFRIFLPRGWIAPVTPGTKFVTVGGMIAADVHGKNHHKDGSFCDHVDWIDIALPGGRIVRCGRDAHADLFAAACGGMGLAGLILRAAFRMKKVETATMRQKTLRAANLDEAIDLFEGALDWTYSVAWIDCLAKGKALGRSVLFFGEHALPDELTGSRAAAPLEPRRKRGKSVPIDFPSFALGPLSVRLFNTVYYRAHGAGEALVDLDTYYYPLDSIEKWNRIYGKRGFVQYQCVLPLAASREGMKRLLEAISAAGLGSFLAVLKRMGPQSFGLLSFPMEGYTLALDFPATPAALALLDRLDGIVMAHGGRIYLAKDARIGPAAFAAGYPRLGELRWARKHWGLDGAFRSLQSERLEI